MEKDSGKIFRELKEDVSAYVELKLELLKLSTYERVAISWPLLSYVLNFKSSSFFGYTVHIFGPGTLSRRCLQFDGSRLCHSGRVIFSSHWARSFKQKYNLPDDHKHCTGSTKRQR